MNFLDMGFLEIILVLTVAILIFEGAVNGE